MNKFAYKARNFKGKIVKGNISSKSKVHAKNDLFNRGLTPIKIVRISNDRLESTANGISKYIYKDANGSIQIRLGPDLPNTKELALFTKQFSLMIENGIPIISALRLLQKSQKKLSFQTTIKAIANDVEKGSSLHEALEPYPKIFDSLYISLIKAGERSGQIDIIMKQLVSYIEKSAKIKAQVKSAMTYPVIIVMVAITVISLLLVYVVPEFAKQFQESGQELPGLTQSVLSISSFLIDNSLPLFVGVIATIFLLKYWHQTDSGRRLFDEMTLKAPIIGPVMTKISIGRFCSTMATMLGAGVSILESLSICAGSSGNKIIENFVITVREEVERGGSFFTPLDESPLFPPLVSSMVEVGENTGQLDETLKKINEIYEDEVDNAIDTMTSLIEPIMIVFIGSIVGFIVLAMYLPVFDMANTVN